MRYESFYPFSGNHPLPPVQQGLGTNPFTGPAQHTGQPAQFNMPQNPFPGPGQGPSMQGPPPGQDPSMQNPQQGQGPSKMDGYMQTANSFFNTAQQFAPVVQQFAPMVKNIPAMWRLYKGFQSMPDVGDSSAAVVAGRTAQGPTRSAAPPFGAQQSSPRIFQPDR